MTELPKTFDPAAIESRWYAHWETTGQFRPGRPGAEPWTIVNPPPNVTGSLHIGHALDNTLQDILTRHARLKGKDALWVVGTDHAGIATQMVVERQMAAAGQKRTDFSREDFVAKVWDWKAESGGTITQQLRRLGCSMDWANERFTMDPHFSEAVIKVFVDLHDEGLLYRDKRLVNWDPGLGTAISDLEVETREVKGSFWTLRYPLEDGEEGGHIEVATTRPETMLADMAVAVHPDDERYAALVGRNVRLPITGRLIPIVADEHADPALGSGAVKITPGHDFNDFEVGKRAGLKAGEMLNMLDAKAQVTQVSDGLIPDDLLGLSTAEARKAVVARLKAEGFLVPWVDKEGAEHDSEPRAIQTPYGDRSGVVIEPWLTDQWYVDAKTLAAPAIEAVRSGAIRIVPKTWEKTFFNWMENIQPWCVSRQLWWGHRIPAWFGDDGKWYVALTEAEAQAQAGEGVALKQDDDVLDTWFSSALWPFATLGWPEQGSPPGLPGGAGGGVSDASALPRTSTDEEGATPGPSTKAWRGGEGRAASAATLGWPEQGSPPGLPGGAGGGASEASVLPPSSTEGEGATPNPSTKAWRGGEGRAASSATLGWPEQGSPPGLPGGAGGGASDASALPRTSTEGEGATPGPSTKAWRGGEGPQLGGRYPNDVLVSGFDILFFWNARMMMQGIHFMGANGRRPLPESVPFRTLYLHGLVRAADGAKMSKSKGNTVDPLGLIDRYGADALRFFMAAMESQGRDIKMDEKRVEGYRNFATKLWNASRFCQANGIVGGVALPTPTLAVNAWIVGECVKAIQAVDLALAEYRFDAAANAIYQFVWSQFCDWYLELIKPAMVGDERGLLDDETKAVAGWVLDRILIVLHPFMPFMTEELWHALAERDGDLIVAQWPIVDARSIDPEAALEVEEQIDFIRQVRALRNDYNVPPSAGVNFVEVGAGLNVSPVLNRGRLAIYRMTRVVRAGFESGWGETDTGEYKSTNQEFTDRSVIEGQGVQFSSFGRTYALLLERHIDLDAERTRLAKTIAAAEKERDALAGRLGNPSFVERAKPEAVEKARADHAEKAAEAERLRAALARLG